MFYGMGGKVVGAERLSTPKTNTRRLNGALKFVSNPPLLTASHFGNCHVDPGVDDGEQWAPADRAGHLLVVKKGGAVGCVWLELLAGLLHRRPGAQAVDVGQGAPGQVEVAVQAQCVDGGVGVLLCCHCVVLACESGRGGSG